MKKALVFLLLITLSVSLVACGGGGDDNGNNGNNGQPVVDWGEKNPNEGVIVTNEPGDRENTLAPAKEKELVGELKVPPHPRMFWTCYEIKGLDVTGNMFEGWMELDRTAESWDAGIVYTFAYEKNPELQFVVAYEMIEGLAWNDTAYFDENMSMYVDGEIIETGEFKHTESMAKGLWVSYKKDGMMGRKMFYAIRGNRISETEFGPGFGIILSSEATEEVFMEAWENGNLDYMFQEVMVTQPMS